MRGNEYTRFRYFFPLPVQFFIMCNPEKEKVVN
jgi:hypothetical protein